MLKPTQCVDAWDSQIRYSGGAPFAAWWFTQAAMRAGVHGTGEVHQLDADRGQAQENEVIAAGSFSGKNAASPVLPQSVALRQVGGQRRPCGAGRVSECARSPARRPAQVLSAV